MAQTFERATAVSNEAFRDQWVEGTLRRLRPQWLSPSLIDVGAGLSRYREPALGQGYHYVSHDFGAYVPSGRQPGLQNDAWDYPKHDYECDILDLPTDQEHDVVLCTEVLEHVPDPVRAFEVLANLAAPGGCVVVTVPFLSLMHQAPFWFSSGLSPFWFEHWAERYGLAIEELTVQGDYADLMAQELARTARSMPGGRALARVAARTSKLLRSRLEENILESGGFGCLFIGRKK